MDFIAYNRINIKVMVKTGLTITKPLEENENQDRYLPLIYLFTYFLPLGALIKDWYRGKNPTKSPNITLAMDHNVLNMMLIVVKLKMMKESFIITILIRMNLSQNLMAQIWKNVKTKYDSMKQDSQV